MRAGHHRRAAVIYIDKRHEEIGSDKPPISSVPIAIQPPPASDFASTFRARSSCSATASASAVE